MNNHRNLLIQGTLILTLASLLSRILGFYNRIFLTSLFGARELGIFQLILPLYSIIFSFSCQGIQTAITKHIAQANITKRLYLFRYGMTLSLLLSLICSFIFLFFHQEISITILHSRSCAKGLKILAFAFPFVSLKGCISGYFIGLSRTREAALAQFIEQLTKILSVYILSQFLLSRAPDASFAVYGVVIGELFSCLYMMLSFWLYCQKEQLSIFDKKIRVNHKEHTLLLKDSLYLTANRLSVTLLQSTEALILPHMLHAFLSNGDQALILYGTLTGMVLPCLMFPTTLTSSLATMLLPEISRESHQKHHLQLDQTIKKSIGFCLLIGVASSLFLFLFGRFCGLWLFKSKIAGELLFQFALLCPFIYLSSCLASILNGLGKTIQTLLYSIFGISIRLSFILLLVPNIGLKGYMWGMMISYLAQTACLIRQIKICLQEE